MNTALTKVLAFGMVLLALLTLGAWYAPTPEVYVPPPSPIPEMQSRLDTAQGDIARLQIQMGGVISRLEAIENGPKGLSGPEVRALVELIVADIQLEPPPLDPEPPA